jgi:type II secretory pathway component PulF
MTKRSRQDIQPETTVSTDKPKGDPDWLADEPRPVVLTPVAAPSSYRLRLIHLMAAVLIAALLFWLLVLAGASLAAGLWIVAFFIVLLLACAVGLVVVLVGRQTTQQESLLWAMAIAAERGLPLAPAALAFADQFGSGFRWRVQKLADALNQGETLPQAIDSAPGLLSREAVVLVKAGWTSGRLAEGLQLAASARQSRKAAWGNVAASLGYLIVVVTAMISIIFYVMYWVIPKFEAIFKDFGMALPALTIFTIQVSHFLIKYAFVWVLLLLAALVALPMGLLNLFQLDAPLFDRLFRRRHSALVLRALALTVKGGKPIPVALATLSNQYPSSWIRARLRQVSGDVQQGTDWVEALRGRGLIRPAEASVLDTAQRVGNLEWALQELATSADRKLGYHLQFWLQLLFPVAVIVMGLVVFVVAVAYFSPLVSLISRLSG